MEIISRTAETESESELKSSTSQLPLPLPRKELPIERKVKSGKAAMWQLKMRRLQAQFECRFSCFPVVVAVVSKA